jgi:hypothetical protein
MLTVANSKLVFVSASITEPFSLPFWQKALEQKARKRQMKMGFFTG